MRQLAEDGKRLYIGAENRAQVTVVELAPTILPGNDADVVKEAERVFRKQGLDLRTLSGRYGGFAMAGAL